MDNPPYDEKTTINVKGVSVAAWERAKRAATRSGDPMGPWLARAINKLADAEADQQVFPPVKPEVLPSEEKGNPGQSIDMTPGDLSELMKAMAALASATDLPPAKADIRRAYSLADDMVRGARGMPRKPLRLQPAVKQLANPTAGTGNPGKSDPMIEGPDRQNEG